MLGPRSSEEGHVESVEQNGEPVFHGYGEGEENEGVEFAFVRLINDCLRHVDPASRDNAFRHILRDGLEQHLLQPMLRLYEDPALQGWLRHFGSIRRTTLHPGGSTDHTLATFAELQLKILGALGYRPGDAMSALVDDTVSSYGMAACDVRVAADRLVSLEDVCPDHALRRREILGRTLIFHPHDDDSGCVAVKLVKKGEHIDELLREAGMQCVLALDKRNVPPGVDEEQAARLGSTVRKMRLRSVIPQPVGIFRLTMPEEYFTEVVQHMGAGVENDGTGGYLCFVYRTVDGGYFQYVNGATQVHHLTGADESVSLGIDDMKHGIRAAMHDIFATAAHGWVFTQLIDLYHHNVVVDIARKEADKIRLLRYGSDRVADGDGRFLVLLDLLRNVSRDRESPISEYHSWGMGRIDNFRGAVAYPNVRRSGVADLGDARTFDELFDRVIELHEWVRYLRAEGGCLEMTGTAYGPTPIRGKPPFQPRRSKRTANVQIGLDSLSRTRNLRGMSELP